MRRKRGGFLLLDVMLALAVATVSILMATSLIVAAAAAADASKQNTIAYNAARQAVENVRQQRGAALTNGEDLDASGFGPLPQLDRLTGGQARLSIYDHEEVDPGTGATAGVPRLKAVTVTVTWRSGDRGGRARSRTLSTLVAPFGVSP